MLDVGSCNLCGGHHHDVMTITRVVPRMNNANPQELTLTPPNNHPRHICCSAIHLATAFGGQASIGYSAYQGPHRSQPPSPSPMSQANSPRPDSLSSKERQLRFHQRCIEKLFNTDGTHIEQLESDITHTSRKGPGSPRRMTHTSPGINNMGRRTKCFRGTWESSEF